jgi:hypothetical protein
VRQADRQRRPERQREHRRALPRRVRGGRAARAAPRRRAHGIRLARERRRQACGACRERAAGRASSALSRQNCGAPIAVQAKLVQMANSEKTATAAPSAGPPVRSRCASGSPAGAGTASVAALNARNIASGTAEPAAGARGGGRAGAARWMGGRGRTL